MSRVLNLTTGDIFHDECVKIIRRADVIVTNPPFSLFRQIVGLLLAERKDFILLGNLNAISYKILWPEIQAGRVRLGASGSQSYKFRVPDYYGEYCKNPADISFDERGRKFISMRTIRWYTTLEHIMPPRKLIFTREYSPDEFPRYDNYNAIEVSRVKDIPGDFYGVMAVPITFMDYYDPGEFELLGVSTGTPLYLNGREVYKRIFIRRRKS